MFDASGTSMWTSPLFQSQAHAFSSQLNREYLWQVPLKEAERLGLLTPLPDHVRWVAGSKLG
jgi:hypothetical protein